MPLAPGHADPVHDAQRAFRAALDALARPGRRTTLPARDAAPPLGAALAQMLLTLTDEATPVWWQQSSARLANWLRFHTGAEVAPAPARAAFAVITQLGRLPPLADFAPGTPEFAEQSTTLLIEVPSLDAGATFELRGPGIRERQQARIDGLPARFWSEWQANGALFPQGVDVLLCCGRDLIGLPRTTRVRRLEAM
jgi:alpha-D-ribose 1-methylphosphonate 5-triphosphate synthase subunit PhnH